MSIPQNEILLRVTTKYLAELDRDNIPSPLTIESELINGVNNEFVLENAARRPGNKIMLLHALTHRQIADIILRLHPVRRLAHGGLQGAPDLDVLVIGMTDGPNAGTYVIDESAIRSIARRYNSNISGNVLKDVLSVLGDEAPRVAPTRDKDLIPVNNGVFNFQTKELMPFDLEKYVFVSKDATDYPTTTPMNPHFTLNNGDAWNFDDWLADLHEPLPDAAEVTELMWEVMSAALRPYARFKRMVLFYSGPGNSGKGTLVELIRNVKGKYSPSHCSIPLDQWGKDFGLESLLKANTVLVDENDVGGYSEKSGNLKAAVTGEELGVNRKGLKYVKMYFQGLILQCVNDFPSSKDKSGSFYRRQLWVPFPRSFTGREFPEIKEVFLASEEVREYVLWRALKMTHTSFSEPESCRQLSQEHRTSNDPIRQFWAEIEPAVVWDLLPTQFVYDLYVAWMKRNNPSESALGRTAFLDQFENIVTESGAWQGKKFQRYGSTAAPHGRVSAPECLIADYDLKDWKNPSYSGNNPMQIGVPSFAQTSGQGYLRQQPVVSAAAVRHFNNLTSTEGDAA